MSWLNLNQSIASIKGQITNFANEVLSEGIVVDTDPFTELTAANRRINELQNLCASQDVEITTLRRQNSEFQQKLTTASKTPSNSNGLPGTDTTAEEEGSNWFWDPPEEKGSETTEANRYESRKDENKRLLAHIEKLQTEISNLKNRQEIISEAGINPNIGNISELNNKIQLLTEENKNLTSNMEDLDNQNQIAMEKMINIKKDLQVKYDTLLREHEGLKSEITNFQSKLNQCAEEREQDLKELNEVNEKLSLDLDTLHHKYENLDKVHWLLKENAEHFQEENMELSEENFNLQEKCTKLQHELEESQKKEKLTSDSHGNNNHVPNEKYKELEEKFLTLERKFAETSAPDKAIELGDALHDSKVQEVIEKLKFEIVELQNKLNTNEEIKRLNLEIDHLKQEIESLSVNDRHNKTELEIGIVLKNLLDKYITFNIPDIKKVESHSHNELVNYFENCLKSFAEYKSRNDTLEIRVADNSRVINNLQLSIDEMNSEMDILNGDLSHYEHECSELKKNNDFLIAELRTLKNVSKLEPILEQNEENVEKLQSDLEDCSNLNRSFEAEIERNGVEKQCIITERDKLKIELQSIKKQFQNVSKELNNLKMKSPDDSETNNFELQQKLTTTQTDLENIKTQLCTMTSENEKCKIDLSILDNEKILLMREISELKSEIQTKSIIEDFAKKVEAEKADLEGKLSHLSEVEMSLEILRKENEALKMRMEDLMEQATRSVSQHEIHQNELELKHSQAVAQINNMNNAITSLQEDNKALKNELFNNSEELLTAARNEAVLKFDLENITKEYQEFTNKSEVNESTLKHNIMRLEETLVQTKAEFTKQIQSSMRSMEASDENSSLKNIHLTDELHLVQEQLKEKTLELVHAIEDGNIHKESSFVSETKSLDVTTGQQDESEEIESKNLGSDQVNSFEIRLQEIEKEKSYLASKLIGFDDISNGQLKKIENLETIKCDLEYQITLLSSEKTDLINLVTQKHQESLNYHAEIQRLSALLMAENERYKELERGHEEAKSNLLQHIQNHECSNCAAIAGKLKENEERCFNYESRLRDVENSGVTAKEMDNLREKNQFLVEKCDILAKNLLIEQSNTKQVVQEKLQVSEREQSLSKELERLRAHLLEVVETHTRELVVSDQKYQELQTQLAVAEDKAKHSSTVYTSNSIRANQEVETLRTQIRLVERQRDDIQSQLGESEDRNSKNLVALTNLQWVLEQFQLDKERDAEVLAGKGKRDLDESNVEIARLMTNIEELERKLEESNGGLRAAARLSSQLDAKTAQLLEAKDQVHNMEQEVAQWKRKYSESVTSQEDKVDRRLVGNLVTSYVRAVKGPAERDQALRLLSSVLGLRLLEEDQISAAANNIPPGKLASEFVRFLERESAGPPPLPTTYHSQSQPNSAVLSSGNQSNQSSSSGIAAQQPTSTSPYGTRITTGSPQSVANSSPSATRNSPFQANNALMNAVPSPVVPISLDNPILASASAVVLTSAPSFGLFVPITSPDVGVNQTRNSEGAILKNVLKDT